MDTKGVLQIAKIRIILRPYLTVEVAGLVFETRYSPLQDQNGEITGVIGVATDITERKRLEEQPRQAKCSSA